jgi:enoyl-CoA hydratase/carnithine racemase
MTDRLLAEKSGPTGWITFNNPERRNAVSLDMWEALSPALERFGADPEVKAVVLRGAGDKAFVSGADISQFEKDRSNADGVLRYEQLAEGAQRMLYEFRKPTIAMIRGYCLGGGLNIALACDLRIAADDSKFGIPAAKMGLAYRVSSTKNLVDAVGPAYAKEILLSARQFSADEALRIGLANRVVPAAALEATVGEYCAMFAANAPLTMATAKFIIRELLKSSSALDEKACADAVRRCFESEDYKEGRRAFMEKRKPAFSGR